MPYVCNNVIVQQLINYLVSQVGEQKGLGQADHGQNDLDNPQFERPVDPQNCIPVDDGVFLELFVCQVARQDVERLVPWGAAVAESSTE